MLAAVTIRFPASNVGGSCCCHVQALTLQPPVCRHVLQSAALVHPFGQSCVVLDFAQRKQCVPSSEKYPFGH